LLARTGEVKLQHIYRKIYTGIGKFIGIVAKPKKYNCFEILFMKIFFLLIYFFFILLYGVFNWNYFFKKIFYDC